MQTARIVQAVVLMMIVAVAASCSASKEYTSKLFAPRTPTVKDSQAVALRFLELDGVDADKDNWVSTDIIMGRDTLSQTLALDKLAETFPAAPITNNGNVKTEAPRTSPVPVVTKPVEPEKTLAAKNAKSKNKAKAEELKIAPIPAETKSAEAESVPVARNLSSDEVRSKRTRDE
jgi:hypothetical protein